MANTKMTKRDFFGILSALVSAQDNMDFKAETLAFIDNELDLLDKKKARATSKPSKSALANSDTKAKILARLAECDTAMTITEFQNKYIEDFPLAVGDGTGFSNQKMSAFFRQLVESGKVERFTAKKKAYFMLVTNKVPEPETSEIEIEDEDGIVED